MSVSAGGGIFPVIGGNQFAILMDFRELNRHLNFMDKFHAGIEANMFNNGATRLALRLGCNQGYFAGGFTIASKPVTFHFSVYGEQAGQYTSTKADYRVGGQFAFDI